MNSAGLGAGGNAGGLETNIQGEELTSHYMVTIPIWPPFQATFHASRAHPSSPSLHKDFLFPLSLFTFSIQFSCPLRVADLAIKGTYLKRKKG